MKVLSFGMIHQFPAHKLNHLSLAKLGRKSSSNQELTPPFRLPESDKLVEDSPQHQPFHCKEKHCRQSQAFPTPDKHQQCRDKLTLTANIRSAFRDCQNSNYP